eukprot:m.336898 g.336898  ORF g.336898 m.336898 type:complete len:551 (+) comp17990_c0_seq1:71-1723(+)
MTLEQEVDGERLTKARLETSLAGHRWTVSSLHFHPAGNMLVSGSFDRTIRIWDATDGKELRRLDRQQHTAPITCVKWHPNGALIASTSADNTTCLWDASTGKKMRTLREHFGWVLSCSFAPDRTKLATASWDKTVRLWDPNTGELIATLRGHTKGVWACAFYPVGHTSALLASSGEDCTARLWDTRTRKVALTLSGGHADAVYDVAWSHNGAHVITSSSDKTITVWDPKAGKILKMLKHHDATVKSVSCSPSVQDNGISAAASAGGTSCCIWNPLAPNDNMIEELQLHDPGKEVECVDISSSGNLIATGSRDGKIKVCSMPYIQKVVARTEAVKSTHKDWRQTQALDKEQLEWQEAVRRRKEKMLQQSADLKGNTNELKIISGFDREDKEDDKVPRERNWKRGATQSDEKPWQKLEKQRQNQPKPVPVNRQTIREKPETDEQPIRSHPMVKGFQQEDEVVSKPKAKKIGDLSHVLAGRRAQTDANAETVSPFAQPVIRSEGPAEPPVSQLMNAPGIGKKIKLRGLSIRGPADFTKDGTGGEGASGAFANY